MRLRHALLSLALLLPALAHAQPAPPLTLAWDAPTALPAGVVLTGYRVYRRVGAGPLYPRTVTPLPPTRTTWTDEAPHRTARNCYRVALVAGADESAMSNEVCGAAQPVVGASPMLRKIP